MSCVATNTIQTNEIAVGKVDRPLELNGDEKVLFAGSCTKWQGTIRGEKIKIDSQYQTSSEVDETKTKTNDMLIKTLKTLFTCFKNRSANFMHAKGCTLSVAEHVNFLATMAGVKNPNFDDRVLIPINTAYWQMRLNRFLNRIRT